MSSISGLELAERVVGISIVAGAPGRDTAVKDVAATIKAELRNELETIAMELDRASEAYALTDETGVELRKRAAAVRKRMTPFEGVYPFDLQMKQKQEMQTRPRGQRYIVCGATNDITGIIDKIPGLDEGERADLTNQARLLNRVLLRRIDGNVGGDKYPFL